MAYIGSVPANQTTGARPRDEFVADGTQVTFPLTQGIPGSFETNAFVVVENVPQQPVDAYTIVDTYTITFSAGTGTFVKNETVTGGTSGATGKVLQVNVGSIVIEKLTGTLGTAETYTGGTSGASKSSSAVDQNFGGGLKFSTAPVSGSVIYVVHQGQATYNLVPAAGSVGATQLDPNLRNFTINQFTGNGSDTQFTLSETPYSINSIVVISDGIVQTKTSNFTLSGATLSFTSAPDVGADIQVIHLGFSSGVKTVPDATITPVKLSPGAPTWSSNGMLTANGSIMPAINATYDLGSNSYSWRNIYTNDLHLSNQNHEQGNDVDGTKGSWTIQEGADDLYIINNTSGRKFKFTLTEVK